MVGNSFMVCVIITSSHLHTPMYFFLCNLSLIDILYSSRTVPNLLVDLLSSTRRITLFACGIQLYAGLFLGGTECLLLAVMAYDRYVAICRPLNYLIIMRWSICYELLAFVWVSSFFTTVVPSLFMPIRICNPNQINHFVCEVLPVVKLSCHSTHQSETATFFLTFIVILFPFLFILLSYFFIISSILKIHSAARSKAFSTCSSHLTVVALLYGTALVTYFGPSSRNTSNQEKYVSVFNTIMLPMINPVIYSLKNKEVTKIFVRRKERFRELDRHV
ncbi:olfactory receptor 2K2-like [Leptodactylus fuscus]